jgi:hypothetical protein
MYQKYQLDTIESYVILEGRQLLLARTVLLSDNFILFQILLVDRLDHEGNDQIAKLSYTVIAIPLWIALIAWFTFSFGASDSNPCLYLTNNSILKEFLLFDRVVRSSA